MSHFGFIGPSYALQSLIADAQVCRNFLVQKVESEMGKSAFILLGSPGLGNFCTLPDLGDRGAVEINGRCFRVCGSSFFEIFADGTFKKWGAVANDGNQASLAASRTQVMIAAGGKGYCFTLATGVLTGPIANIDTVAQVGYSDGYFVGWLRNSGTIQISGLLDGENWDLTQKAIVSVFPGNIVSMIVDHREICLLGDKQSQCYYDSGNNFPYDVIPGGFMEEGSTATFGACKADNTYFWIGQNQSGFGIAWRAQGYNQQRISNHAIESAWQSYSTISDAVAYSYQEDGHTFIVWRFPTANKTWVYDIATGMWHERSYHDPGTGQDFAHRSNGHVLAFGKHLVGDPVSGNVYQMSMPRVSASGSDWDFVTDFGNPIHRVRRTPHLSVENQRQNDTEIVLDIETGLGPQPPLLDALGNARGPQVMLRWSNDGSKTFGNEHWRDCGQAGEYLKRVIWNRLGQYRDRVYELSYSDPVPIRIIDAYRNPHQSAQERMVRQLAGKA